MPIEGCVLLSGALFVIGMLVVLVRRNAVVMLMGVELMLNAVNLLLVTGAAVHGDAGGQAMALVVMAVAAAEVAVGLGLVVAVFRRRRTTDVDLLDELKG